MENEICIVIPAYNEEKAIAETIRDYREHFPDAAIVVVDNNSSDKTSECAQAELADSKGFVIFEPLQGKGNAVKTGLSRVDADIYIMTDGDGTYPAYDARKLLGVMLENRCDMVVGDRLSGGSYMKQNKRAGHNFGNKFLSNYISSLSGQQYRDVLSGLRIMSRPFVAALDVRSSGFQLETELNIIAAYLRANVIELPIEYLSRPEGSFSKLSTYRDGIRILQFAILNWIAFYPLRVRHSGPDGVRHFRHAWGMGILCLLQNRTDAISFNGGSGCRAGTGRPSVDIHGPKFANHRTQYTTD